MDRVFSSGASATPPSPPVSPSSGYCSPGNPANGTPATKLGNWWYHMVTESLRKVITYAGLTPSHTNLDLLSSAIQSGALNVSAAVGTADAITASYSPAITALTNGMRLYVRTASANQTTTPSFTPNNGVIPPATVVKGANQALALSDIAGGGHWIELQWDATLSKWVLQNPASTTGVTPAQFDNSTKLATTAFVQRALGSFANNRPRSITSAVTLTGADSGTCFELGSAAAVTLPLCSSVPIGTVFIFTTSPAVTTATINRQGTSDTLAINNGGAYTSYTMGSGSDIMFINDGRIWRGNFGQETLRTNSALFASAQGLNGYQKLPSGLMFQWGQYAHPTANNIATQTFSYAFPNACLIMFSSQDHQNYGGTVVGVTPISKTQFYSQGNVSGDGFNILAIGY